MGVAVAVQFEVGAASHRTWRGNLSRLYRALAATTLNCTATVSWATGGSDANRTA